MTLDRLDSMRTFVEIVDAGSFSAAAFRLGVSVPAVSRRMLGFEMRVGARLLERTTRHLELTEPGRRYYHTAKRILADVAIAEAELDPRGSRRVVRISAPDFFGRAVVAPLLPDFLRRHRDTQVELSLTRGAGSPAASDADARIELGKHHDTGERGRVLGTFRYVFCAAPEYLARAGMPTQPEDLLHHECILMPGFDTDGCWPIKRGDRHLSLSVSGRLACDDSAAVVAAVLAGSGVARMPAFQVRDHVQRRQACIILPEFEDDPAEVRIVEAQSPMRSRRVRALIDHLAHNITERRLGL